MKDYTEVYEELGLHFEPLDGEYTPDEYAKKLLKGTPMPKSVIYAGSTNDNRKKGNTYKIREGILSK